MFLEETCFWKECVFISIVLPEGMCFRKEHASRRNSFQEGTCFWKRLISRKNILSEETCFQKAHYWPHTSRSSYSYKCLKVIQKAYMMSMLSRKTWDAEASCMTYLMGELSVRLHHEAECSVSHSPWPGSSPLSPLKCLGLPKRCLESSNSFKTGW